MFICSPFVVCHLPTTFLSWGAGRGSGWRAVSLLPPLPGERLRASTMDRDGSRPPRVLRLSSGRLLMGTCGTLSPPSLVHPEAARIRVWRLGLTQSQLCSLHSLSESSVSSLWPSGDLLPPGTASVDFCCLFKGHFLFDDSVDVVAFQGRSPLQDSAGLLTSFLSCFFRCLSGVGRAPGHLLRLWREMACALR